MGNESKLVGSGSGGGGGGGGVEDSVVYSRWWLGSGGCLRVLGGVLITCLGVGHQVGMFSLGFDV